MRLSDRQYTGYVFDCDGTVYVGDMPLPGAVVAISQVRAFGARTMFLTNRPTSSSSDYAERLTAMGIPTGTADVVSSIDALVWYLSQGSRRPRLMVVGEALLCTLLREAGFEVVDGYGSPVDCVVVAFDRTFDYPKLKGAFDAVNAGARIVATNPDRYCPSPDGGLPDCAAMLAALEACTGARAEAIVGKPSRHMAAVVRGRLGVAPSDALLVGDRLETDMLMARELGMDFALVLTGVTTADEVASAESQPDYVIQSLLELLPNTAATGQPGTATARDTAL
jgi:HAD superfamily hydrolase (TIGR01450 family)